MPPTSASMGPQQWADRADERDPRRINYSKKLAEEACKVATKLRRGEDGILNLDSELFSSSVFEEAFAKITAVFVFRRRIRRKGGMGPGLFVYELKGNTIRIYKPDFTWIRSMFNPPKPPKHEFDK